MVVAYDGRRAWRANGYPWLGFLTARGSRELATWCAFERTSNGIPIGFMPFHRDPHTKWALGHFECASSERTERDRRFNLDK